jgi:hypothetical protein
MLRSPRPRALAAPPLFALIALALSLAACETISVARLDQPPTVTLTSGPIDTASTPQAWNVRIEWTASDPDGAIDHFEYTVDPPTHKRAMFAAEETVWVSTREQGVTVHFTATRRDTAAVGATSRTFHVFALRAIDDRGGVSPLVVRAFYATTVAPDVQITRPAPSQFIAQSIPLPFRVDWHGHDADGEGAGDPVGYRYRVLDMSNHANLPYVYDPDSLLREAETSGWAHWTSVPGESTSAVVTPADLPSSGNGLFALAAVDAAGATTPYLMLDRNALYFYSLPGPVSGPRIHVFNQYIDFTYPSGGYSLDPAREIPIQVGYAARFEIHWDAVAALGRTVVASRWMIDGNITDETPRSGPGDYVHWSEWGPPADGLAVPPLPPGLHHLYIEERDDFDYKSLAIVRIESIAVDATADLLVVDDTRLEVDKITAGGCPGPYTQSWPSAAELDTFLYARGSVPWRCARNPVDALSPPGLLAGYAFDTLGTRQGLENPAGAVPLATLAHYRHVLWIVDARSAGYSPDLYQGLFPTTALRAMSMPGRASALGAYIQMGGKVWLAGGGTAYASLISFDRRLNNAGQVTVFTARDGELGPGRPMYDAAHVRSALGVTVTDSHFDRSPAAVGGWAGHGPDGTLSAPDYALLPAVLTYRDPLLDPIPPTRLPSQAGLFYPTSSSAEFVLEANNVTEDFGSPGAPHVENALDTLYQATGLGIPIEHAPAMLYYHGRESTPFVFTGFDLWTWTRADCQGLVDFVLGDIWQLTKTAPGATASRAAGSRAAKPVAPRIARPLDPRIMRP